MHECRPGKRGREISRVYTLIRTFVLTYRDITSRRTNAIEIEIELHRGHSSCPFHAAPFFPTSLCPLDHYVHQLVRTLRYCRPLPGSGTRNFFAACDGNVTGFLMDSEGLGMRHKGMHACIISLECSSRWENIFVD